MSAIRVPAAISFLSFLLAATALPAQTPSSDSTQAAPGMSMVRIVRLSIVSGAVQMDRGIGHDFEPAIVNLPIVEHASLRTGEGVAEVEFEDNSTLRLAPQSEVEFPVLERRDTGPTVSAVRLLRGTAYVTLLKTPGSEFTLLFGQQNVPLPPGAHVRLQMSGGSATLAIFDGTVHLDGPGAGLDVPKKHTVAFSLQTDPLATSEPTVTKTIASESFDSWDKQSSDYHARAAFGMLGQSPYSYGSSDLDYYGAFSDGGCGMMWQPYFAGSAWNPYANGTWAWYQGAGYSWVSPYPWGWMPYHYGSWAYCPGAGWGWMPGGAWNGINNIVSNPTNTLHNLPGPRILPNPPKNPPGHGEPSQVAVNLTPLVASGLGTNHSFVFRRDSAGLGIPREQLGKLSGFSHSTLQRGTISTPIYLTVAPSASTHAEFGARAGASTGVAPIMIHRGSAPAPPEPGFSIAPSANPSFSNNARSSSSLSSTGTAGASHGSTGGTGGGGGHPH